MTNLDLKKAMEFAADLAIDAGRLTSRYYRSRLDVETKSDNSPVTRADREAEKLIRRRIEAIYPGHGILGEEFGHERGDGEYTWIVDPIDGTRSFVGRVPLYSVLIACIKGPVDAESIHVPSDDVLVGVIHLPEMHETVFAARDEGAFWRRIERQSASTDHGLDMADEHLVTTPCRVSQIGSIDQARILTTDFADLARRAPDLLQFCTGANQTRTWGDAAGYLLVATGRAEAMIDPIMSPWDIGPLPVIVEEAGGAYSDLQGNRVLSDSSVATNGRLSVPL